MKPRNWLIKLCLVSVLFLGLPIGSVIAFNYYIDPFWAYTHSHDNNDIQLGFNERIQKTNWLNARAPLGYNDLLIGTSRTTYINASNFEKPTFHYGLSSLHITEYLDYMKYAEKKNGQPFETIYMEMTSRSFDLAYKPQFNEAQSIIDESEKEFYRLTHLFSNNTFERAKNNYEHSKVDYSDHPRIYDRDMHVTTYYESKDIELAVQKFIRFQNERQAEGKLVHFYDPSFKQSLVDMKESFPQAQFVVFTDLILMERLNITFESEPLRRAYKRYIREMVEVFGTVYSFHVSNEVTTTRENFFDLYHFYPQVGDLVAQELQQRQNSELMTLVTEDNIEEYFAGLGI